MSRKVLNIRLIAAGRCVYWSVAEAQLELYAPVDILSKGQSRRKTTEISWSRYARNHVRLPGFRIQWGQTEKLSIDYDKMGAIFIVPCIELPRD